MKKKIGRQNKEPLGSSSIMVLDKRRKKGGWSWAGFAKPRPSSSIVPRRTGGSLWSTWEWRDWLQPKERKKTKTKTTRSTSGWMRGCGDSCQTLGFKPWQFTCTLAGVFSGLFSRQPPEGIVRSAYVRKAKRTITPQWASVLPGSATRSVFPRPPAARCPGSLHKAGGTSQGKLLPWWREKRVISFCFIRGWRKKKKEKKKTARGRWRGGKIGERFRSSSLRQNDNITNLTLGRIDDFSALH